MDPCCIYHGFLYGRQEYFLEQEEIDRRRQVIRRCYLRRYRVSRLVKTWYGSLTVLRLRCYSYVRSQPPPTSIYRKLTGRMMRLLEIDQGHSTSTLVCTLVAMDLDHVVPYVALSYCWQHDGPKIPIILGGTVFHISKTLALALLHLRQRRVGHLWVDALCINQDDNAERSSQVRLMHEIYGAAKSVIVWLGDSTNLSLKAFNRLHAHLVDIEHREDPPFEQETVEAMREVLSRPWFRRVWILQEVLLAKKAHILCGEDCLDWDPFLKLVAKIDSMLWHFLLLSHDELQRTPLFLEGQKLSTKQQLEFMVRVRRDQTDWFISPRKWRQDLLWTRRSTCYAEATDPRDKVYGILSLVMLPLHLDYPVDYDLSTEQVSLYATQQILATDRSLNVLSSVRSDRDDSTSLPSWSPHWACTSEAGYERYASYQTEVDHELPDVIPGSPGTSLYDLWPIHLLPEDIAEHCAPQYALGERDTLTLKGICFDEIRSSTKNELVRHDLQLLATATSDLETHCNPDTIQVFDDFLSKVQRWINRWQGVAITSSPYPTSSLARDALWKLMSGMSPVGDQHPNPRPESMAACQDLLLEAQSIVDNLKEQIDQAVLKSSRNFAVVKKLLDVLLPIMTTVVACLNDSLGLTYKGYLSLLPLTSEMGDLVCVVYGSVVPIVLRPMNKDQFRFMGLCRVQDLDFGNVVRGQYRPRLKRSRASGRSSQSDSQPAKFRKPRDFMCI